MFLPIFAFFPYLAVFLPIIFSYCCFANTKSYLNNSIILKFLRIRYFLQTQMYVVNTREGSCYASYYKYPAKGVINKFQYLPYFNSYTCSIIILTLESPKVTVTGISSISVELYLKGLSTGKDYGPLPLDSSISAKLSEN